MRSRTRHGRARPSSTAPKILQNTGIVQMKHDGSAFGLS
jgi:hypothetical protein